MLKLRLAVLIVGGPLMLTPLTAGDKTSWSEQERRHWAFQVLTRPKVPPVKQVQSVRTPVDAFVLARLEGKGLSFSPEADRTMLIRRAAFDLTGLPLSSEDVEAFLKDSAVDAYEKMLDRLLASPRFGERWGRHWLDGAGYVDVMGTDNDAGIITLGENKWRYRDWVVRAFNDDKPFDRFLTEQLAGDELVDWRQAAMVSPEVQELLIATGFLRTAADDTDAPELNTPDIRHGVLQRTIEVVAGNLLGLTLTCTRCHDHKYEPISQQDYYRFQALFQPAFNPDKWLKPKDRQVAEVGPREKARQEKIAARIEEAKKQQAALRRSYEDKIVQVRLGKLPEAVRGPLDKARQTPAGQRDDVQKKLFTQHEALFKVQPEDIKTILADADRTRLTELDKELADLNGQRRPFGFLQAVYDVGPPTPTHLLKRGNHLTPGKEVSPGYFSILAAAPAAEKRADGPTSGRRLALAQWLTQAETPSASLVLRVRVNRIWQQLFGQGLVATGDNFGLSGARPSHPELLEWLAAEFRTHKQLKPLVKLLMSSTVYRQTSAQAGDMSHKVDPDNRLLWRMRLRRLESESIRDTMLAVSGKLNATIGGAPIPIESLADGRVVVAVKKLATSTSQYRRSLYLTQRRNYHPTILDVFDQPNLATNCTSRAPSAGVLQTLTMLNDGFVLEQAGALAERVERTMPNASAVARIDKAFLLALGRMPRKNELALSVEFFQTQIAHYQTMKLSSDQARQKALGHFCHVLLNSSELLYVP